MIKINTNFNNSDNLLLQSKLKIISDFTYSFTINESSLLFGLKYIYQSEAIPFYFEPTRKVFAEPVTDFQNFKNLHNGLNFYINAELGNAFVKFQFRNLLGQQFTNFVDYPLFNRHVRFSVTWAFND